MDRESHNTGSVLGTDGVKGNEGIGRSKYSDGLIANDGCEESGNTEGSASSNDRGQAIRKL